MTDHPITGSVAFYATLLWPIERLLVLIWPSVCPITNKPDTKKQEEELGPTRTLNSINHIQWNSRKFTSKAMVLTNKC